MSKNEITTADIRESLWDANLDTEYREALAHGMILLDYVSDSPLNLSFGTEEQKDEIKRVETTPLNANQLSELIHLMMYEMRNDFQYGRFKPIAFEYIKKAEEMQTEKSKIANEEYKKPICNIKEAYGNMYEIIGLVSKTLKQNNLYDESREMIERVTLSYDYDEAFNIIKEYVEPVELENFQEEEEEFE